jgi:uracil-DNA glycosylase
MKQLHNVQLTVLVGGYAHKGHLGLKAGVTANVKAWRDHAPDIFLLPHPSWRNTGWIRKNPWFENDLIPVLQKNVRRILRTSSVSPKA